MSGTKRNRFRRSFGSPFETDMDLFSPVSTGRVAMQSGDLKANESFVLDTDIDVVDLNIVINENDDNNDSNNEERNSQETVLMEYNN